MINYHEIIPELWKGVYVSNEDDLVFLGSNNLEILRVYWECEEQQLLDYIDLTRSQFEVLAGKTIDDVREMATVYDYPEFPKIGIPAGSWSREPEPLDAASAEREPDTTSYNCCGWCKHHTGGLQRFNCRITTTCHLIPEELNNGNGRYGEKFRFNTPCAITNGTQEFLDACVAYLGSKLAGLTQEKAEIRARIDYLSALMERADRKPYFASHRPSGWVKAGDEVACYISNGFDGILNQGVFVAGEIIANGYHDGCTSVRVSDKIDLSYGLHRPEVVRREEFEYLKAHSDYLKVWLRASADIPRFNPEGMTKALI